MLTLRGALGALAVGLAPIPAMAQAAPPPSDIDGRWLFESRLRGETIDQEGYAQAAHALTLRTRAGWRSPTRRGLQVLIEGEGVTVLDDRYSAPMAPDPSRPAVADGEALELNRAQLRWTGPAATEIVAGRQRLVVGNGRFVGNSGWRQNEQTFDALRISTSALRHVTLTWTFADRVRRPLGADHSQGVWRGQVHLLQAEADTPAGRLAAFGLTTDFDNAPAQSSKTIGARLSGSRPLAGGLSATWTGEYAVQRDNGANPLEFTLDFQSVILGVQTSRWSAGLGYERFEGDGAAGFQTPLGSGHGFLGWSDVIGPTPAFGLRDQFVRGQTTFSALDRPLRLTAEAHDFKDAAGARDLGRELDLSAALSVDSHWSVELAAAHFVADHPIYADTDKAWLSVEYRY